MSASDRQLVDLITEITDHGMVLSLESALADWGRAPAKRLIADEFAVIRRRGAVLDENTFLPAEEAVVLIDHLRKTDAYIFMAAPWAPLSPEYEPTLVASYVADEPEAVEEVRRVHAERRARLCR